MLLLLIASYLIQSSVYAQSKGNSDSLTPASNLNFSTTRYLEGDEILFTLVLDKYALGEVNTLVNNGQFYVHLDDFISSANFMIEQSTSDGDKIYEGWWANQKNTFTLIFPSNKEKLKKYGEQKVAILLTHEQEIGLSEDDIIEAFSEIYVRTDLISSWFKVSLEFNETKLWMQAKTQEPWPFQLSQQREKAKVRQLSSVGQANEPHYDPGYQLISPQTIDFLGSIRANKIQSEERTQSANYSVLGRQDLFGLSTRFYVAGNDDNLVSQGTIDFSKHWLEENRGPLGISQLKFGDVQAVRVTNNSSAASRGIFVSSTDLEQRSNQETTNISGLVQSGWDLELYQNKILVKQLFDVKSGRYEFLDLTLFTGLNKFEVIKYGPQGQIEKESFERFVDASINTSTGLDYQLSLTQNNRDTLGLQNVNSDLPDNLVFSGSYFLRGGASNTFNFSHSNQLGNSTIKDQYRLSMATRLGEKAVLNSAYLYTPEQSQQMSFNLRSNIWDQDVSARINLQKNDAGNTSNEYAGGAQMIFSGNLFRSASQSIYQRTELQMQKNFEGDENLNTRNQLAYRNKWFGLNHSIDYQQRKRTDLVTEDFLFGTVNANVNFSRVNTRFGASYSKEEDFGWDSLFLNANWYAFNRLSLRAEYVKNLQTDNNSYALGLDWKHELYGITARFDHSDLFDTSFSISTRFSFAEAPTEFGYIQSKRSLAEYGTVLVRVYHDVNNNRIYDADDIPLKGVKVSATQSRRNSETDIVGIAQLDGLSSFRKTDLQVDLSTLPNSLLVQSTFNTSVTPRAGLITLINYPMVEGVELEGEVSYIDEFSRVQYVNAAPLVILDSNGNKVTSVNSSFDGYFYITDLIPHTYYLSVDEEYLDKMNFKAVTPRKLVMNEQGKQLFDINIQLEKKPRITGFVSLSGEFDSPFLLSQYYELLEREMTNQGFTDEITPFEHRNKNNKLSLGLLFTKDREQAERLCDKLLDFISSCTVEQHTVIL